MLEGIKCITRVKCHEPVARAEGESQPGRVSRQEKAELLTAIQEKGRREALTEEEKAELLRTARQLRLESDFATLEKQVRMLRELAERSPVIRGETTRAIIGALQPEAEYVIVERQQMNVLLEGADLRIFLLKELLQELCKPGELRLREPGS